MHLTGHKAGAGFKPAFWGLRGQGGLFPVPGLAEEARIEDFSGGFPGGRGRDVENRPVGQPGVLLGVRLAVRLPEGGAAVEDDVAPIEDDVGIY